MCKSRECRYPEEMYTVEDLLSVRMDHLMIYVQSIMDDGID